MRIRRPRGRATGWALAWPAMNIVRGPVAAPGLEGCRAMRFPQAPQKAKPTWTILPQLGQGISLPAGAAAGGGPPVTRTGAGVAPAGMPTEPPLLTEPDVTRGAGAPASGFGGSWNGMGAGILGESPHGMPLLALGTAGDEVRSSPATLA